MGDQMNFRRSILVVVTLGLAACATPSGDPALRRALEADVRFLADDLLEGRDAGTRGYNIAARYVAERFRAIGLVGAGDDGSYLQRISLFESRSALKGGGTVSVGPAGALDSWTPEIDYLASSLQSTELNEVPIIFAGLGFVSEAHGRNDFDGLDVEGKIVATIYGAPKYLNSEEFAHFRRERSRNAYARGAVGTITLYPPSYEEQVRTFSEIAASSRGRPSTTWAKSDGEPFSRFPNSRVSLSMGQVGAEKLFAAMGRSWSETVAQAETDEGRIAGFDTGLVMTVRTQRTTQTVESANVLAVLPGSDPELARQVIAVTGHLDHIGTRRGLDDTNDHIFNGAMDNAVGIAGLLDIAARFKANPPKRTILFAAMTAEERGLIGSRYLAENLPIPASSLVGMFNFDMPILHENFTNIVVFGIERTTMKPAIAKAVRAAGLTLTPDPNPEQGFFVRSDQISFIRKGIPAAYIDQAIRENAQNETSAFLRTIYHKVGDEAELVYFNDLARFSALNAAAIRGVANTKDRPLWVPGDFFGRIYGGPMAEE